MLRSINVAAGLLALAVLPLLAQAQSVLINNTSSPGGNFVLLIGPPQNVNGAATSFVPTQRMTVTGADVFLTLPVGFSAEVVIEIRPTVLGGSNGTTTLPGPTVLASATVQVVGSTDTRPVNATFGSSAILEAGTRYWLAARQTTGTPGAGSVLWRSGGTGGYAPLSGGAWNLSLGTAGGGAGFRILGFPVTGACCNPVGSGCATLTSAECAGFGGIYRGDGSVCAVPQCFPVGACCRGASCELTTQPGCLVSQIGQPLGRWLGAGSICSPAGSPNVCCTADINGSGAGDIDDIFIFLNQWFAGCP
jgi:hypothetical protein